MTGVHLAEGGEPVVIRLDDGTGDTLSASGVVDAHRLGGGLWQISPATKVGVVTIGEVTIWIRPKVDIARILFLMGFARDPGWRTDAVDLKLVHDLVPALARAFADQTERALDQGLLQGYIEVEDSLPVLRGRLREQDQLRRRFGVAIPLLVRFDDYTVDIPENRILRAATEALLRLPGIDPATLVRLRGIRLLLADVSTYSTLAAWQPTRLNSRYHVALWLGEVILAGNAVDQAPGNVRISGFLLDMAKVYEDFLVAALARSLGRLGGLCRPQDRLHLDVASRVAMRPDLVWYRDGEPAAVVDAKYKVEKPSGFPDADLYQMLAYCTALRLEEGHLVYAKGNAVVNRHEVRHSGIVVATHTIDLALHPTELLAQVESLAGVVAGFVA
ncbi:MAG: McrC family protein [Actinobacteria bacterium]|nr:McrC family protein [Actinomycetota bacterium]